MCSVETKKIRGTQSQRFYENEDVWETESRTKQLCFGFAQVVSNSYGKEKRVSVLKNTVSLAFDFHESVCESETLCTQQNKQSLKSSNFNI